jgi:hypothetical protein
MTDSVQTVEYYDVIVDDEAGAVQTVLAALGDNDVNLLAFLGFPAGEGRSQIDLVPEDPAALRAAAERLDLDLHGPQTAFLVQGDERVGAVAEITSTLADAGVNITAAAAVGAGSDRFGIVVWVAPDDHARAAKALGA